MAVPRRWRFWCCFGGACALAVLVVLVLAAFRGGGTDGLDAAAADVGRYRHVLGACRIALAALVWWRWAVVVRWCAARGVPFDPATLHGRRHAYLAAYVGFDLLVLQGLAADALARWLSV